MYVGLKRLSLDVPPKDAWWIDVGKMLAHLANLQSLILKSAQCFTWENNENAKYQDQV